MKRLVATLLFAVTLVGSGCGDSDSPKSASRATTSTAPGADDATTTTTARGGTTTTARGGTTTTAKGASATTTTTAGPATTTTTVPVTSKTDRACVHPGEIQGLTVTGPPGSRVIYDTIYSDGSGALTKGYATGSGRGTSDDNGVYYTTWSVPPNAPPGPAKINIGMVNGSAITRSTAYFTIKAVGALC